MARRDHAHRRAPRGQHRPEEERRRDHVAAPGFDPRRDPASLDAGSVAGLQRTVGNRAVGGLLAGKQKGKDKADHKPPVDDEVELEVKGKSKGKGLGGGTGVAVQRFDPSKIPSGKMFSYKAGNVTPKFALSRPLSKRSNSDSSTTLPKKPSISGTIAWDNAASKWRFKVDSITSPGVIQLVYYSWGHYPAPFPNNDAGPLLNVTKKNWKAIVKDLTDNRTGIADDWSAYLAEDLHEDYHWFQEWIPTITPKFTQAQNEIAALGVGDTDTSGQPVSYWDARATLRDDAKQIFTDRVSEGRATFNALGDAAGDPPYIAQAPAIDNLIRRVRDHAASKKWT